MEIKLVVLLGKAKGREIPLPPTQFIIGRGSLCHLRPHSEQVSKVHCAIGRKPGNRVFVRDLKSLNKTFGTRILIAGRTHELAASSVETRGIDRIALRGRTEPPASAGIPPHRVSSLC